MGTKNKNPSKRAEKPKKKKPTGQTTKGKGNRRTASKKLSGTRSQKPTAKKSERKQPPSAKRKKVPKGRTLKTKDEYLPIDERGKSDRPKEERWVAVIDANEEAELAVVRMTTQKKRNTFPLDTYKKGNMKKTRIKTFVETEDREGKPIVVDGVRFIENPPTEDLSRAEIDLIIEKVTVHAKQASENIKKLKKLHKKKQD